MSEHETEASKEENYSKIKQTNCIMYGIVLRNGLFFSEDNLLFVTICFLLFKRIAGIVCLFTD